MKISVLQGDITRMEVDGIVNAANSALRGGGGVDGAIHRAGGPVIMQECLQIGGCPTGQAVVTSAGDLPASKVIHTVGPVWQGGGHHERELLASAYSNSLHKADEFGLKTLAFPNISTGVYGFPKEEAAQIAIEVVSRYGQKETGIIEVYFVCFDEANYAIYQKLMGNL